ncbi:DDE-type integrase/transposase/recombinase, partial [Bacillus mycoides]
CFVSKVTSILKGLSVYQTIIHCRIKNFSHLIDQNHRHVKRRFAKSAGFQNLRHASRTIKGIETIHALYKQRRSLQRDSAFSTYNSIPF